MTELGRLERITNIRSCWPDEACDFTPWLAEEENLSLLAEQLGFGADGFELEGMEINVGPFRADILCRDANSAEGERILIENQYGKTDHDHLGKLITYSSGLKARTVVLICEEVRQEHRAALDWLNEITDEDHRFFAVCVQLFRIGNSPAAPKFEIVVQPNDWAKTVKDLSSVTKRTELTELNVLYIEYWDAFAQLVSTRGGPLRPRKPAPQHWTGFGMGRVNFELNATVNTRDQWIRTGLELFGPNAKGYLALLKSDQEQIEYELGFALDWGFADHRQGAKVAIDLTGVDPTDRNDWRRQHVWMADHLEKLHAVFHNRVRELDKDAASVI